MVCGCLWRLLHVRAGVPVTTRPADTRMPAVAVDRLAELAFAEACRHPVRSPARRAAAALWTALCTTSTLNGARNALPGFTTPETAAAALALMDRLAATAVTATEGTPV